MMRCSRRMFSLPREQSFFSFPPALLCVSPPSVSHVSSKLIHPLRGYSLVSPFLRCNVMNFFEASPSILWPFSYPSPLALALKLFPVQVSSPFFHFPAFSRPFFQTFPSTLPAQCFHHLEDSLLFLVPVDCVFGPFSPSSLQ